MADSKERVVAAVNYLIQAPNYARLINEMTGIIEKWDTHPMTYGGQLAHLNAMIDVGLTNRDAFEKLVKLIERKRKLIPEVKRVDYQRDFMTDKRARIAKAVELHELQKGPLPNPAARKKHGAGAWARWMKARDEFVASKGTLSWADRNAAKQEFWEVIDRNLDTSLAAERAKIVR